MRKVALKNQNSQKFLKSPWINPVCLVWW